MIREVGVTLISQPLQILLGRRLQLLRGDRRLQVLAHGVRTKGLDDVPSRTKSEGDRSESGVRRKWCGNGPVAGYVEVPEVPHLGIEVRDRLGLVLLLQIICLLQQLFPVKACRRER